MRPARTALQPLVEGQRVSVDETVATLTRSKTLHAPSPSGKSGFNGPLEDCGFELLGLRLSVGNVGHERIDAEVLLARRRW